MSEVLQEQDRLKFYGRLAKHIATSCFSTDSVVNSDDEMFNGPLFRIRQRKIWQLPGTDYQHFKIKTYESHFI